MTGLTSSAAGRGEGKVKVAPAAEYQSIFLNVKWGDGAVNFFPCPPVPGSHHPFVCLSALFGCKKFLYRAKREGWRGYLAEPGQYWSRQDAGQKLRSDVATLIRGSCLESGVNSTRTYEAYLRHHGLYGK
jgi:hypothetical protein